jgi:hypothetical protein
MNDIDWTYRQLQDAKEKLTALRSKRTSDKSIYQEMLDSIELKEHELIEQKRNALQLQVSLIAQKREVQTQEERVANLECEYSQLRSEAKADDKKARLQNRMAKLQAEMAKIQQLMEE